MQVGRVEGTVVCTVKDPTLSGIKLLLLRVLEHGQERGLIVATDATRQAGPGDLVTWVSSKEASLLFRRAYTPTDASITGFVDAYNHTPINKTEKKPRKRKTK